MPDEPACIEAQTGASSPEDPRVAATRGSPREARGRRNHPARVRPVRCEPRILRGGARQRATDRRRRSVVAFVPAMVSIAGSAVADLAPPVAGVIVYAAAVVAYTFLFGLVVLNALEVDPALARLPRGGRVRRRGRVARTHPPDDAKRAVVAGYRQRGVLVAVPLRKPHRRAHRGSASPARTATCGYLSSGGSSSSSSSTSSR
jgi:hypothetical protein